MNNDNLIVSRAMMAIRPFLYALRKKRSLKLMLFLQKQAGAEMNLLVCFWNMLLTAVWCNGRNKSGALQCCTASLLFAV